MVTVKQLIESLKRYDENSPVEIEISQYNKKYPIAYVSPQESYMVDNCYATQRDGKHVRISVTLPTDKESKTFMYTATKNM